MQARAPSTPWRVATGATSIVGHAAPSDNNVVSRRRILGERPQSRRAFRLVRVMRVMLEKIQDAVAICQVFRMLEDGGPLPRPRQRACQDLPPPPAAARRPPPPSL